LQAESAEFAEFCQFCSRILLKHRKKLAYELLAS
jgi:hypothetical protein